MKHAVSFVRRKFNQMLAVATVTMSVNYIVMLSGSVIVGNMVGADGLSGVNTCTPIFGIASFLASILSVGSALVFSRAMGAFDERRAAGVFSQSMMLAAAVGACIYVVMRFGGPSFLDFAGVTGAVRAQAEAYLGWQSLAMALLPAVLLMEALVYADGDVLVASAAGAVHVIGSLGLSVWFTKISGDAGGVAQGTAFTMVAVLGVCALHLFRTHNHLRFRVWFSAKDLGETCAASMADSTIYLCWGVLVMAINKFTVVRFGQDLLPLVALAASVVEFSIVFDGVGEALIPIGGMYDGEGNRPALRELARHSAVTATLEGTVFGALFYCLAPQLAPLYGIRGDAAMLLPEAVWLIRALALAMPFMGLLMMVNTHFLVVHRIPFAVSVTVVKDFICPCICSLSFGWLFGTKGMWVGFTIGYVLAAFYPFAAVLIRFGSDLFPWLIERDDGKSIDFAVKLSAEAVDDSAVEIAEYLNGRGIYDAAVGRIADLVRENGLLSVSGAGRSAVSEYFVSTEDPACIRLVIRDTGRPQDVNLRSAAVSAATSFRYLNTLGCNRTEYRFDIAEIP